MEIDGPTSVSRSGNVSPVWVKVCLKKLTFLAFKPVSRAGFPDKMLALSNKKSTFVLVSGLLAVVFSQFCQILFERFLFTKKAPLTNIITISKAKLRQIIE